MGWVRDFAWYNKLLHELPEGEVNQNNAEAVNIVDYLFTRGWSKIRSVDDAEAFLDELWPNTTPNEREYIYDIYCGKRRSEYAVRILEDRARDIELAIDELTRDRDEELAAMACTLSPDIQPAAIPGARPDLEYKMTKLEDIYRAIDEERAQLEAMISMRPPSMHSAGIGVGGASGGPGGAKYNPGGIDDPHDYRVYKLLALADAYHDFNKKKKKKRRVDKELIRKAIEAEHPDDTDPKSFPANEEKFIEYMEAHPKLRFGEGVEVGHTLHGRGLLNKFDVAAAMNDTLDFWLAYRQQCLAQEDDRDVMSADVWSLPQTEILQDKMRETHSDPTKYKTVVYLSQIVDIIARIKKQFGTGDLTFVPDKSDHPLTRMLMATPCLDVAIRRFFVVKMGKRVLSDSSPDSSDPERPATDDAIIHPEYNWRYKVCDVSLVDGNKHVFPEEQQDFRPNPSLSKEATGPVFRREDKIQVEYGGITGESDFEPSVRVTVSERTAAGTYDILEELVIGGDDEDDSEDDSEDDAEKEDDVQDLNEAKDDDEDDAFSISAMKKRIQGALETAKKMGVTDVDISQYLSRKRSCDWGVVEHCKQHGHVFVSTDRLSCMYAMYRNVKFILMRELTTKKHPIWVGTPEIFQTVFVIGRALTPDEEARKLAPIEGGALTSTAPLFRSAMAVIVVACALIGSIARRA